MRSLIDTQDETLTPAPPAPAGTVRAPRAGTGPGSIPLAVLAPLVAADDRHRHRRAAGQPGRHQGGERPGRSGGDGRARRRRSPGRPRSAQPVDDRVSFGQLEGLAEVDEDRTGDIYFVTISEPQQSVLSWWAAGGATCGTPGECAVQPEIDFLTREEKFGRQSPDQRRQISLQMMRTSSQVAQYVALQALGYDDASILPGDVVVSDIVCLEPGDGECARYAPADDVLDPGDTILTADGVPLETVDDLVAELAGREPGDTVELEIDRPGARRSGPSRSS